MGAFNERYQATLYPLLRYNMAYIINGPSLSFLSSDQTSLLSTARHTGSILRSK